MAACLLFWFGQVPCQEKGINLFLKLGGKFVGNLDLPDKSLSAFLQVRNLQRQASLLCGHPTRSYQDILLFAHNVRVGPPGMAYLDDLDEEASLHVQSLLQGCTSLEMMYDESDEYAKHVLEQAKALVSEHFPDTQEVYVVAEKSIPREVTYLTRHGVTKWNFYAVNYKSFVQDFGFLKNARFDSLTLTSIMPTDWTDCNAKRLHISTHSIDCQAFKILDRVEELQLWAIDSHCIDYHRHCHHTYYQCHLHGRTSPSVTNWKGLYNFPNLKHLRLRCDLSRQDDSRACFGTGWYADDQDVLL